ncbi:MAG: hypothetical protein OQK73_01910, partial [Gammaproteobacteria bacterium]|nr:hypothetical protein [Gammaproteobacteria bacterium]
YADNITGATGGYAPAAPECQQHVTFTEQAQQQCSDYEKTYPQLRTLIENLVALDPRPAYKADEEGRIFSMRLLDFDLRWTQSNEGIFILALDSVSPNSNNNASTK